MMRRPNRRATRWIPSLAALLTIGVVTSQAAAPAVPTKLISQLITSASLQRSSP
jgi:hypothetical protein